MTIQCPPNQTTQVSPRRDTSGLEELIVECLPELRGFVGRRMGPAVRAREAVSDVVQSTCRELLAHRERFRWREGEGFRRWLYSTALRKILNKDRFHTANRRDAGGDVALLSPSPSTRVADPSEQSQHEETLECLREALDRLPEDYRKVVILAHLACIPRSDVAREMNRTEGAVRNLLHRALASLGADLATHLTSRELP